MRNLRGLQSNAAVFGNRKLCKTGGLHQIAGSLHRISFLHILCHYMIPVCQIEVSIIWRTHVVYRRCTVPLSG